MNIIDHIRAAGREGGWWLTVVFVVAAFAVGMAFNPVDEAATGVKDQIEGEPYFDGPGADLAMGEDLVSPGLGASGSTVYPRYTSTRTQVVWKPVTCNNPSDCQWSLRGPTKPQAIIVHVTAGRPDQCDGTANYGEKNALRVSWHLLICNDKVYQQVEFGDAAHHAGRWGTPTLTNPLIREWWNAGINPNVPSIGIETSLTYGYHINDQKGMRENLIESLVWLSLEFDIPPDRTHIIGHFEVDGDTRKDDPICCINLDQIVAEVAARVEILGVPIPTLEPTPTVTPAPSAYPFWDGERHVFEGGREGGWSFDPVPLPYGIWYFKDVAIFDNCDPAWAGRRLAVGIWDDVGDWNYHESVNAWIQNPPC